MQSREGLIKRYGSIGQNFKKGGTYGCPSNVMVGRGSVAVVSGAAFAYSESVPVYKKKRFSQEFFIISYHHQWHLWHQFLLFGYEQNLLNMNFHFGI